MNHEDLFIGVVAGLLVAGIVAILKPAFKWIWERTRRPSPLSLQDKVRLADQLTQNRKYLAHVIHMSNHPMDLFLRLFRFNIGIVLAIVAGQALFLLRSAFEINLGPIMGLLGFLIVVLSAASA